MATEMSDQERGHNGFSVRLDEYTTENNNHTAISGNIIACVLQQRGCVPFYNTTPHPPPHLIQPMHPQIFPRCPIMPSAISFWFKSPAGIHLKRFMTGQLHKEVLTPIKNVIG